MIRKPLLLLLVLAALIAAACDSADDPETPTDGATTAAATDAGTEGSTEGSTGGGGEPATGQAMLTLGDETIVLDRGFGCFGQPQDVAGSPGQILVSAQFEGTNAAGENVLFDFSRYDEESLFTGDDILVDVGELGASVSYRAVLDLGASGEPGGTLAADNVSFQNQDDGSTVVGAFSFPC